MTYGFNKGVRMTRRLHKLSKCIIIKNYAKEMAFGSWLMGDARIKFDDSYVIRDGHHRLAAIRKLNR